MEVKDIINEGRPVEPHSFETDNEEIWYKIGVHDCYEDFCQNRIARSTKVSGEALIRETDFIHDFIKEHNCIPTISDAIEATRKQMVDKACKLLCDICYFGKNARNPNDFCKKCKAEGGDYYRFTKLAEE